MLAFSLKRFFSGTKTRPLDRDHLAESESKAIDFLLSRWQRNQPTYSPHNYFSLAREGYSKNEVVYACINERATSFTSAPLRVYRDGEAGAEEIPTHGLRQLMLKPNPMMSAEDLWISTVSYYDIAGNAFWWKVRSAAGRVVEVWPLRPDRMRILPDPREVILGYQYEVDGTIYTAERQDIIHFKRWHPINDYFGLSPLQVAARMTDSDNEATDFVQALLQNSAQHGVAITTEATLDDSAVERMLRRWKQKFSGKKRGEPVVLQKGMDVKPISMTLRELEFPDLRNISETRICSVYQVPPIVVGMKAGIDKATYANYEEARRSFWEEAILPLMRSVEGVLNIHLTPEYGDATAYARFDESGVRALQEKEDEKWTRADKAYTSGWITRNEARSIVGQDPVPNGDVFLRKPLVEEVPVVPARQAGKAAGRIEAKADSRETLMRRLIEEAGEVKIRKIFLEAVDQLRSSADATAIRAAIEAGNYDQAAKLLDIARFEDTLRGGKDIITSVVNDSGELAADVLAAQLDIDTGISFDVLNPRTVAWIRDRAAKLVVEISDETQLAIRETIRAGVERGVSPASLARHIRQHVGLTSRDQVAVLNYWAKLLEDNPDGAEALADTYAKRLLKRRSENIARTESAMASHAGQQQAWNQAAEEGLIDKNTRKGWITTEDDRLCDSCMAMDGQTVPMDADFVSPDFGPVPGPPLHPSCRCDMRLILGGN